MKLPDDMMQALRGRAGLLPDDKSQDEEISEMPPRQIVKEIAAFNLGHGAWADSFHRWFKIVGIIEEKP